MPTADEHIEQARQNEALSLLREDDYPDWAVTTLFYASLHWVEAYFYHHGNGQDPRNHYTKHVNRTDAVIRHLPVIQAHYQSLLRQSMQARYDCIDRTPGKVRELRRRRLDAIRGYILPLIS